MPAAAKCHPSRPNAGRGLCAGCYEHHRRNGTLHQHPLSRWRLRMPDFAVEYAHLRSDGLGRANIAARLGVTRDAIDQAYKRAVRAGLLNPDRRTA